MSEFIPWSQLAAHGVLGAEPSQTVKTVRRRLCKLGGHSQFNAPILIRLANGTIAPTDARMLRKLAQIEGPRILNRQLGDLMDALCPEPWLIETRGPAYEEAVYAANERRLPVIVAENQEHVGLMLPSSRRALDVRYSKEEFDLFDEPFPRPVLDEIEFVAATLNTPVAKIAVDLKSKRVPEAALVVVQMDDGSYGVTTTPELRDEMNRMGTDVWGEPARILQPFLHTAACREWASVGYQQAKAIADAQEFLVLTEKGVPAGLLARKTVMRGLEPSALADTADFLSAPERALADAAPKAEPGKEPRFVNFWFADRTGQTQARSRPLELNKAYVLKVNIGRLCEESIIRGEYPPIQEPPLKTAEGTTLYVSLFADECDFDIPNPTKTLCLPPEGDSLPLEFEVTPLRRTFGPGDRANLDIHVYYHCNVVQSWRIRVEIVALGQEAQTDAPQEPICLADRTKDYAILEQIGPRQLSVIIDRAPDDTYLFDFVVAADDRADEIRLSCRVKLSREDLVHLITKARRQFYSIARSQAYQKDIAGDPLTRQKAMHALAVLGRQLYSRLFEFAGPESSASRVGDWIKNNLPDGSTLQVIDRAHSFIFPWSLVYDEVPWDRDGLSREVAMGGFWGYRYKVEILTEELMQTYQSEGAEIGATAGVRIGIGLNEGIPWSKAQRGFFEELKAETEGRADYTFFDSSAKLTEFLEQGNQHVFYLFCHGFTERMAADIQMGDDLIGDFRAWLSSLPGDQRQTLRDQEEDLFDVSDSWIKLTYGTVPLTMMEYYAASRWDYAPLVFLNMCESAQVLPSLSGGFIPFFLRRGVRGVIGTECPMNSTFADPFARAFFQQFLAGRSVGEILWGLRRQYLDEGNPLGLAYTLYGDACMKLSQAIRRSNPSSTPSQPTRSSLEQQIDKLWLQEEKDLYITLGINQQAVEEAKSRGDAEQLARAQQYEAIFTAADAEMGMLNDLEEFGKRWWAKLEPKIYDLLCNRANPQHSEFMQALLEGAKMLAIALVPSLVAPGVLPAVAVVVATIAAKRIYEAGLEAACEMWAESMQQGT